jgi:transketolase
MELPTIFVFTHDAMGGGENGPTHQPVEHLASLRAIPGLITLRPGDANEVVEAYRYVMQLRHQPAALVLSRQPLPTLDRRTHAPAAGVARGAYVLADAPGGTPEVILIASGSELSLAVEAHEQLLAEGIRSRVVSMPSWEIFDHHSGGAGSTPLSIHRTTSWNARRLPRSADTYRTGPRSVVMLFAPLR